MLKKILFTVHNSLDCLARQSRKSAFTLAETLIVMGIIGVVAALTLPNLNSSTGDKEKAVRLQKLYQNLNDAYSRATVVYGPIDTWPKNGSHTERFMNRLLEFMKYTKVCNTDNTSECTGDVNGYHAVIFADGSTMMINNNLNFSCVEAEDNPSLTILGQNCGYIMVDIDGPSNGKYQGGTDRFLFYITKDNGFLPKPFRYENDVSYPADCFRNHNRCTTWVIENGNMDYLKADSSGKCNNSDVTLSETVTSCK